MAEKRADRAARLQAERLVTNSSCLEGGGSGRGVGRRARSVRR